MRTKFSNGDNNNNICVQTFHDNTTQHNTTVKLPLLDIALTQDIFSTLCT